MSDFKAILAALADGAALDDAQATVAFEHLLSGEAAEAEIAAFLMALRVRGEAIGEIVAGAKVLRAAATPIPDVGDVVDTCGTGGDGADTFNISTAAAIVAAAAGARVAKHGNRAVSSKSGSSDVLAALGVNVAANPETVARCVREAGVGFLFAPSHHAAMRHVAGARKVLGLRTIFNMIGPLTNPAGARFQVLGVYAERLLEPMAHALQALGAQTAWVVHGSDGLDELTTTGDSHVAQLKDGAVTRFTLSPGDAGLPTAAPGDLAGGGPQHNAAILRAIFAGEAGPARDIVVLNAGAALAVSGRATDLADGARQAGAALDAGRAVKTLEALVALSNSEMSS